MSRTQELRATANAMLQAWRDGQADTTLTNAELRKLKQAADAAHDRLMHAVADNLGGTYAVGQN